MGGLKEYPSKTQIKCTKTNSLRLCMETETEQVFSTLCCILLQNCLRMLTQILLDSCHPQENRKNLIMVQCRGGGRHSCPEIIKNASSSAGNWCILK